MTQGKDESVAEQVEQTESDTGQTAQQEPSLDELRSELEKTRQELQDKEAEISKWQTEAKSHQKNVTKKDSEIQRLRDNRESIETRLGVLTEMVADLVDSREELSGYEAPKKRRSEEYLARLKTTEEQSRETQSNSERQRVMGMAQEADKLLQSVGLSMDESPEAMKAYNLWLRGDYEDSVEEVKKLVEQKNKSFMNAKNAVTNLVDKQITEIMLWNCYHWRIIMLILDLVE